MKSDGLHQDQGYLVLSSNSTRNIIVHVNFPHSALSLFFKYCISVYMDVCQICDCTCGDETRVPDPLELEL